MLGEPICINRGGIEFVFVDPLCELVMALMLGITHWFEELGVAPRAADVFGRTASGGLGQARIERSRLKIGEALDFDRVLPAVAEVVDVSQRLRADVFEYAVEPGLTGVEEVARPIDVGTKSRGLQAPITSANYLAPDQPSAKAFTLAGFTCARNLRVVSARKADICGQAYDPEGHVADQFGAM